MIDMMFGTGGLVRKVRIENRNIIFLSAEMNFQPIEINLDKLDEQKDLIEKLKTDKKFLEELKALKTEHEIAKDITTDFNKSGWRLIKKHGID